MSTTLTKNALHLTRSAFMQVVKDGGGNPQVYVDYTAGNYTNAAYTQMVPGGTLPEKIYNYAPSAKYPVNSPTAAPVIANVGAAGSTTYDYAYSYVTLAGETLASPLGTTTTGNATLDGTNYNTAGSLPTSPPANVTSKNLYRRKSAGTWYKIASVANATASVSDTGLANGTAGLPANNTSVERLFDAYTNATNGAATLEGLTLTTNGGTDVLV